MAILQQAESLLRLYGVASRPHGKASSPRTASAIARRSAATRNRVSRENHARATGSIAQASQCGRTLNWYRNITRVPAPSGANSQAPPNDSSSHGPRVIFTAASRGGANVTYSVSMPMPILETHHDRTPTSGLDAPPTSSARDRNGSHLRRRA